MITEQRAELADDDEFASFQGGVRELLVRQSNRLLAAVTHHVRTGPYEGGRG
ncbi:hypothetical protein [Streptomyces sp. UG1]|uniref:hypothetical protein n=1 Tax=Streptomyces sp. UG1 TaxID=3417652 RepID=UPI003CF1D969